MEKIKILLKTLTPQTLAALAADLENTLEDWKFYPEDAPSERVQHDIGQLFDLVLNRGQTVVDNFDDLLEQARDARDEDDWISGRNRQVRQNWYSDLE